MSIKVRWEKALDYNNLDQHPLLAWIDLCNYTLFRISAYFVHGGRTYPGHGLVVGIERKGCFFFKWPSEYLRGGYVAEKLNLGIADGSIIADWINVQFGFEDAPQQGSYYEESFSHENEPNFIAGERALLPLKPELINAVD